MSDMFTWTVSWTETFIDSYSQSLRQGLCNGTVSVCPSVPSADRCSSGAVRRVCCCGPDDHGGRGHRSSTACSSSKCEQCHTVS